MNKNIILFFTPRTHRKHSNNAFDSKEFKAKGHYFLIKR